LIKIGHTNYMIKTMNRYKPIGWRNESYRHSLASKGIKTSFKGMILQDEKDFVRNKVIGILSDSARHPDKDGFIWMAIVDEDENLSGTATKFAQGMGFARPVFKLKEAELPEWHHQAGEIVHEKEGKKSLWVKDLAKSSSLAAKKYPIPPAWKNVKHYRDKPYVVTGVDEKGRTQYIYPASFVDKKAASKFKRIDRMEKQIPTIMSSVQKDIKKDDNPEAEVVYTMYKTGFRPGTTKDTKADVQAYGASTLLKKHVKVHGNDVQFKFIAKKGVPVEKKVNDKLLADIMKKRKSNDKIFSTSDTQVRGYFDKKTHGKYNLKDLRTLRAQRIAKQIKGDKKEISTKVSEELGNTPAVAAGSYISPRLLNGK